LRLILSPSSLGCGDRTYTQRPYPGAAAGRLGTEHRQFTSPPAAAAALLPRRGGLLDEPLADPAFMPTVHLAGHIRQWVTVALSGDGGDELLCGYPTFLAVKPVQWVNRLPAGLIGAAARSVDYLPGGTRYGSPGFLLKQFFRGAVHPLDVAAQIMMNGLTPAEQASLVGNAVRAANVVGDPYDDVASIMTWAPTDDPISRLVYHHCKLYLAGQTLVKMDRATMAHGVEARAPFLDPALVALACAMPSSVKVRGLTTKAVLKRALKGRLPDQILTRRKQGFGVPIAQWFRGPLRPLLEATFAPARLRTVGLLDPDGVSRLVTEHVTARQNHGKALWSLLTLELWREAYLPDARWA